MEKKFNEQESLQLITEMIAQTRNNFRKENAFSYIFIGYSLAVISLLNAILLHVLTPSYMANWAWALIIPVIFISFYKNSRDAKNAKVHTHIESIISGIWIGFMWSLLIVFMLLFGFSYIMENSIFMLLVTPLALALTGLGQFATAIACRYKPFLWGAVTFWLGALACMLYYYFMREGSGQYVIFAACIIIGFIVPGHMLNSKAEQDV